MAKKIIVLLSSLLTAYLIVNVFFVFRLSLAVQNYLNLNFAASQNRVLIQQEAGKIIKNYKKIDKNLKKIVLGNWSTDFSLILEQFLSKNQHCLILLQNSDELRASGGFIGSYLFFDFNQGKWEINPIQDIYDLSGQQTIFPPAPTAYQQYLGDGQGFSIQDSNWWPETDKNATQILNIYQTIEAQSPYVNDNQPVNQLVFLNLNFLEKVLELIGPIELPDYQDKVSSDNFSQLARANRLDFFAGSNEKANFLNHFKTALLQKIARLSWREKIILTQQLLNNLDYRQIQIYSTNEDLNQIWQKHNLKQSLTPRAASKLFFSSIETNIGINKANRLVERHFTFNNKLQEIEIKFINHHQKPITINDNPDLKTADHLAYVNYQRFYFSPDIKIKNIQQIIEHQATDLEFSISTTYNQEGQELKQVDLIFNLPEKSEATILIQLAPHYKKELDFKIQSGLDEQQVSWTISSDQLE